MAITERNAAKAYARAWNRLDCTEFIELLAPDAYYNSQWVFEELVGKESIKNYFTKKLNAVKEGNTQVYAELAVSRESFPGRHCVAMAQDNKEVVQ